MKKEIPEEFMYYNKDPELTPGDRDGCLGNGEHGYECCCDECDYFLACYPEYDTYGNKADEENKSSIDR